jgi:hypothetical protein
MILMADSYLLGTSRKKQESRHVALAQHGGKPPGIAGSQMLSAQLEQMRLSGQFFGIRQRRCEQYLFMVDFLTDSRPA